MKARILSPWIVEGDIESKINVPLLSDVLARFPGWVCTDATSQPAENIPTDPNLYIIELTCDAPTLAAIEADSRFCIVHRETDKKDKPTTAQGNALRQWLRDNGMTNQDARDLAKDIMTREEISDSLIGWLRTRPKKK